jgi:Flp pilus assembly protein TadD
MKTTSKDRQKKMPLLLPREKGLVLGFLLIILMTTIWVYRFVYTFDFVNLDDHLLIFQDYSVRHFDWRRAFISPSAGLYHPLTTITFLLENRIFGLDARIFHINNLAFHLANILLVFRLSLDLTKKPLDAAWLSAFFALSPLSVESVAWIAERKDVLSTFFLLLSCLTYIRAKKSETSIGYWVATTLFVICSYLTKPSTVVIPIIFLWLDGVEKRPISPKAILSKVPFFLGALAAFAINWHVQTALRGHPNWPSLTDLLIGPLKALAFYLAKLLVPTDLSISYPYGDGLLATWQWVTVGTFLVLLLWTARDQIYRKPIILSMSWFAIILMPMLKIVPFGDQSPVNDRFLYLAGLGYAYALLCIGKKLATPSQSQNKLAIFPTSPMTRPRHHHHHIAHSLSPCLVDDRDRNRSQSNRIGRFILLIASTILLAIYANLAMERTLAWRSTESIWKSVLEVYPEDGRAHANLARFYQSIGKVQESILHFKKAIDLKGDKVPVLLADLAYLHIENSRDDDARHLLDLARHQDPNDPRVLNIEGVFLWRHGDISAAETKLREALERPPGLSAAEQRAKIMNNLGLVLASKKDFSGAIQMYHQALDLQPDVASTLYNLGLVYLSSDRLEDAVETFNKALAIDPNLVEAWADLGVTFYVKNDLNRSTEYLRKAVELSPEHTRARRNLSIVLAKKGRCHDARTLLEKALGEEREWSTWPPEVKACEPSH